MTATGKGIKPADTESAESRWRSELIDGPKGGSTRTGAGLHERGGDLLRRFRQAHALDVEPEWRKVG